MDMLEALQKYLSQNDFARMQAYIGSMAPERRAAMMKFLADRETLAPAVGDAAPDFELPRLDGKGSVRLSSFKGGKPVALIFGSFT